MKSALQGLKTEKGNFFQLKRIAMFMSDNISSHFSRPLNSKARLIFKCSICFTMTNHAHSIYLFKSECRLVAHWTKNI